MSTGINTAMPKPLEIAISLQYVLNRGFYFLVGVDACEWS